MLCFQVLVNGHQVINHTGGYDPFTVDITAYVNENEQPNTLAIFVFDPTDYGRQPFGKQKIA